MDLYLLRHADAVESHPGGDQARPLSPRGQGQAEALGRHLARAGVRLELILTSPLRRSVETAAAVGAALGAAVRELEALGPGFDARALTELLRAEKTRTALMLVGHNPDLERLAQGLAGTPRLGFGKATLMKFELRGGSLANALLSWVLPAAALAPD